MKGKDGRNEEVRKKGKTEGRKEGMMKRRKYGRKEREGRKKGTKGR